METISYLMISLFYVLLAVHFGLMFFLKIIPITANPNNDGHSKESRIRLGVLTSLALMLRASL